MNKSISLKTLILVLTIVVVIAACGIGMVLYLNGQKDAQQLDSLDGTSRLITDANALEGGLDGESLKEQYRQMIEKAEQTAIVVNFSESIILPDGDSEAEVQIANPVENNYPMQFILTLEDSGEKIYESGLVPLGSHLDKIKFTKKLEKGQYPAILTYRAYDENAQQYVSSVNVSVTITVEE